MKLGSRAFDLLVVLVERDSLVGNEELMRAVWQDRVVEESNVPVQVSSSREVSGSCMRTSSS